MLDRKNCLYRITVKARKAAVNAIIMSTQIAKISNVLMCA
jgi:hypothetical protein